MKSELKDVFLSLLTSQAGAGAEEAEGRAADEQAERAGAAKSRLQPDQQREEPETGSFPAQTIQHAAPEQVSLPPDPEAWLWLPLRAGLHTT